MTKSSKKVLKRSKKQEKRRRNRRRAAVQHEGDRTTEFTQSHPGYDVVMIRDFLEQLLLELRLQQCENVRALRSLRSHRDLDKAQAAAAETSPAATEQLAKYHSKYFSVLLPANAIDADGATGEEVSSYVEHFLASNIEMRDAEIGHLEALQDVFDEALLTAKLQIGITQDQEVVVPRRVHQVREVVDDLIEQNIPVYEDLLPEFEDHPLATTAGIEMLKESPAIMACSGNDDSSLLLYSQSSRVQAHADDMESDASALAIRVFNYRELQFVISAIRKFVGPPLTDGSEWKVL